MNQNVNECTSQIAMMHTLNPQITSSGRDGEEGQGCEGRW
jgi:hypothetical protein